VSLESLDAQLISKALEKREYILGQARKEAERIKAQAQAEVERIKEMTNAAIENILKGEARAVYDRIVGGAQLEGRKKVMNARLQVKPGIPPNTGGLSLGGHRGLGRRLHRLRQRE